MVGLATLKTVSCSSLLGYVPLVCIGDRQRLDHAVAHTRSRGVFPAGKTTRLTIASSLRPL